VDVSNKADKVRSLRSSREQVARMKLGADTWRPLTRYVEELPLDTGFAGLVPYFDPLDGGT
jgi:hypothetical protein